MKKLIEHDEAAKLLGISSDELNVLRDRKQIYPKRDGDTWKYSEDEIQRYLAEKASSSDSWGSSDNSIDDIQLESNDQLDSILLSEEEFGESTGSPKSTIIGKSAAAPSSSESDIRLSDEPPSKSVTEASVSDVSLFSTDRGALSDVRLAEDDDPGSTKTGGSGSKPLSLPGLSGDSLVTSSDVGAGSDLMLADSGALRLSDEDLSGSDKIKSDPTGRSTVVGGSDALKIEPIDGSDLMLQKDESSIGLSDEDVLGGPGSDITISAADSGISLIDPADSGLSLEQTPMGLSDAKIESLELGDDDVISLEEDVDLEAATQLKSGSEFLLTPMVDGGDESDSGSQVIALDSDAEMSSAEGVFAGAGLGAALDEDIAPLGSGTPMGLGGLTAAASPAPQPVMVAASPEGTYTVWNILSLTTIVLLLAMGGMMTYDLVRQMWSWDGPYALNSSILDALGNTIGWLDK